MRGSVSNHRSSVLLRTAIRLLAAVAGVMACALPRLVHGQDFPLDDGGSGSVAGSVSSEPVSILGRGFGAQVYGGHLGGNGVGRTDSLSHVSIMPYINIDNGLFFGDARIGRGNVGGVAYSFGGGYRHYLPGLNYILGVNAYYDNDQLREAEFTQWGIGGEIVGEFVEARANWSNPFGETEQEVGLRANPDSARFQGNSLLLDIIRTDARAFEGFDAELGVLLPGKWAHRAQLRAFGGGYWYDGGTSDDVVGWKGRLQSSPWRFMEMFAEVTQDNVFNSNFQIGAELRFGGARQDDSQIQTVFNRIGEPVRRNRHIVQGQVDTTLGGQQALNADGTALNFIHVRSANLNAGPIFDGSFENPFQTVGTALPVANANDVVFVHTASVFGTPDNPIAEATIAPTVNGLRILGDGRTVDDRDVMHRFTVSAGTVGGRAATPRLITFDLPAGISNPVGLNGAPTPLAVPVFNATPGDMFVLPAGAQTLEFSGFTVTNATGTGVNSPAAFTGRFTGNFLNISGAAASGVSIADSSGIFTFTDTVINHGTAATGPAFNVVGGAPDIRFTSSILPTAPGADAPFPTSGRIVNTSTQAAVNIDSTTGGEIDFFGSSIQDGSDVATANGGININQVRGDVRLDNVQIQGTTAGITIVGTQNVVQGNAGISFLNSHPSQPNQATTIDGVVDRPSIDISELASNEQVNFRSVVIPTRENSAISIREIAGDVSFSDNVTIGDQTGGGAASAVEYINSLAGSSVVFRENLTIGSGADGIDGTPGSVGDGILIQNPNATDLVFTVNGRTNIDFSGADQLLGVPILVGADANLPSVGGGGVLPIGGLTPLPQWGNAAAVALGTGAPIEPPAPAALPPAQIATNDQTRVTFGDVSVTRNTFAQRGILLNGATGVINFNGTTTLLAEQQGVPIGAPGVSIYDTSGGVFFENLTVTDGTTSTAIGADYNPGGVDIINNSGDVQFDSINIDTVDAEGLYAHLNRRIRIGQSSAISTSTITSDGETAVNITDSGVDITLQTLNSFNSVDDGLILVNTFSQQNFGIAGAGVRGGAIPPTGTGGTISGATHYGARLLNSGRVLLAGMNLTTNGVGVGHINRTFGVDDDIDTDIRNNRLRLLAMSIEQSNAHAVLGLNIHTFEAFDSNFFDNGTNAAAVPIVLPLSLGGGPPDFETMFLQYDELLVDDTTPFTDLNTDMHYEVVIERSTILDQTDDSVQIATLAGAIGSEINIEVVDNNSSFIGPIRNDDTADPLVNPNAPLDINGDNDLVDDNFVILWNGAVRSTFLANQLEISDQNPLGTGVPPQRSINIQQRNGDEDVLQFLAQNNAITGFNPTGTNLARQQGIFIQTSPTILQDFDPTEIQIINNQIQLQPDNSTGMQFVLRRSADVDLEGNVISVFEQGTGINFSPITGPSILRMDSNTITVNSNDVFADERGFVVNASGTIGISGAGNFVLGLIDPSDDAFFSGIFNGVITINGITGTP